MISLNIIEFKDVIEYLEKEIGLNEDEAFELISDEIILIE